MTSGDLIWEDAAKELVPAKSLARIDERARQVVTSIGVVGTLLTGLGLVAGNQVAGSGPAGGLALASVITAATGVVTALTTLLVRIPRRRVALGNLTEVQRWYRREFGRAWWVVGAGLLTVVAVLLAGSAAVVVLLDDDERPVVSFRLVGAGDQAAATARVSFTGLDSGATVRSDVVGLTPSGTRVVAATEIAVVGPSGTATSELTAGRVGRYVTVVLEVVAPPWRCAGALAVGGRSAPTMACHRT